MPNLGPWELLIILFFLLILFGAHRLTEIGSAMGQSIRNLGQSLRDVELNASAPMQQLRNQHYFLV